MTRIAAALEPAHAMSLCIVAAACWATAFLGYGAAYAPILLRARVA